MQKGITLLSAPGFAYCLKWCNHSTKTSEIIQPLGELDAPELMGPRATFSSCILDGRPGNMKNGGKKAPAALAQATMVTSLPLSADLTVATNFDPLPAITRGLRD